MRQSLKIAISLLVSLLLFAGFSVLAFAGLFQVIQASFFLPRLEAAAQEEASSLAALVDSFHSNNLDSYAVEARKDYVAASFLPTLSDTVIKGWDDFAATPGVAGIRLLGADGRSLLWSSFATDIRQQSPTARSFANYTDDATALPAQAVIVAAGAKPRVVPDPAHDAFVYALPVSGSGQSATLLVSVSRRTLLGRLSLSRNGAVSQVAFVDGAGLLVDGPSGGADSIVPLWNAAGGAAVVSTVTLKAADGTEAAWRLFTAPLTTGGYLGIMDPASDFQMSDLMKALLLATFFLTVFLLIFLILNLRTDPLTVLRQRVKRFQIELITELVESSPGADWGRWRTELEARKAAITGQIQRGIGRVSRRQRPEIEEYMSRSWAEILDLISRRSQTQQAATAGALDLSRLESLIQAALKNAQFVVPAEKVQQVPAAPAARVPAVEELDAEDVEDLEEIEPAPPAAAPSPSPAALSPARGASAPAALSSAAAPAEGEDAEDVEEAEAVEAEPVEAALPAGGAVAEAHAAAVGEADAVDAEVVEEAESAEEAELAEEAQLAEEAEPAEEAQLAEETEPAAPSVPELPKPHAAPAAAAAQTVPEIDSIPENEVFEVVDEPAAAQASLDAAAEPSAMAEAEAEAALEELAPLDAQSVEIEFEAQPATVTGAPLPRAPVPAAPLPRAPVPAAPRPPTASASGPVVEGTGDSSVDRAGSPHSFEEVLEELMPLSEIQPLPPEPQEEGLELLPTAEDATPEGRSAPEVGMGDASPTDDDDLYDVGPGYGAASARGPAVPAPRGAAPSGEVEELEVVEEGTGVDEPVSPGPTPDEQSAEMASLVGAGALRSWSLEEVSRIVENSRKSIVMEDGIFQIRRDVYAAVEAERASAGRAEAGRAEAGRAEAGRAEAGRAVPESSVPQLQAVSARTGSGLRELAERVVRHGQAGASSAGGAAGGSAGRPIVSDDTAEAASPGSIGDLLADDDAGDLTTMVNAGRGAPVEVSLPVVREKSNPMHLKRNGLDYDEFLSCYPRAFNVTTQMKSLVEVSRRVSAVGAALLVKKPRGYAAELTIGISEKSAGALTFEVGDPVYTSFLLPRKAFSLDKSPLEVKTFRSRFDSEDLRYMKRVAGIPATFRGQEAFLILSFTGETSVTIESLISGLIVQ